MMLGSDTGKSWGVPWNWMALSGVGPFGGMIDVGSSSQSSWLAWPSKSAATSCIELDGVEVPFPAGRGLASLLPLTPDPTNYSISVVN